MSNRDIAEELQRRVDQAGSGTFRLRLYIAGNSPRSRRAVTNLQRICDTYLKGRVDLEVVDIFQQAEKASEADIIAAPTLIKELPAPLRRLLGDLSDDRRVLIALDIDDVDAQDD